MKPLARILALAFAFALAAADPSAADEPGPTTPLPAPQLMPSLEVDSQGVFLDSLVADPGSAPIPHVRLTNAPAPGKTLTLTRLHVQQALVRHAPDTHANQLSGPDLVRITRRCRELEESEFRDLLKAALQRESGIVGDLEVRLGRAWTPRLVPDDPLSIRILELPASGIGPNIVARFDLLAGQDRVDSLQLALQCRLFREVPVARANLQRGQRLVDADTSVERRDVLTLREPLPSEALVDTSLELAEPVRTGQPLLARSVRTRPLIHRGGIVEALVQDGNLVISLKVEALEDGFPGQTLRVRNPRNRREFVAKVHNEDTVLLVL